MERSNGSIIGTGFKRNDGRYEINAKVSTTLQKRLNTATHKEINGIDLWNRRLGHTSMGVVESMAKNQTVKGASLTENCSTIHCMPCTEGN